MLRSSRLLVCLFSLSMAPAVLADDPAPSRPSAPPVPPGVPNAGVPNAGGPSGPAGAASLAGAANAPLPSTPAERKKLLSNLYAYLATAEDEKQAAPIAQAIERLWLFADSDTIGVLMDRGAKAIAEKDYDLALRFMDAVVDLAPDYAEGWNRRAYVYFLRNDIERMVGDLRRCLALEPNHFRALEGLAQVMRESGQKKAALKAYERLLEVHPNTPGLQDAIKELARDVDGQRT
jgi:tetratricopeptide (TPR) repeat protein